jgi:hypothetical protein
VSKCQALSNLHAVTALHCGPATPTGWERSTCRHMPHEMLQEMNRWNN